MDWVPEERLADRAAELLRTGECHHLSRLFLDRFVARPMTGLLQRMIPYLGTCIARDTRAGQGEALPPFADFRPPEALHLQSYEPSERM